MKEVRVKDLPFSNRLHFVLIVGSCQMESLFHAFEMAEAPVEMTSSFDKENRTSVQGVRGLGLSKAFDVFAQMKEMFFCPIIRDVQEKDPCQEASSIVDILQILDFLCRQTDVLVVAAKTQVVVNIKKGQFLPPWDMKNVLEKLSSNGKKDILLTERGVSFGYNTWICDPRSFLIMVHETTLPVIIDATHSVQNPGGAGSFSSGDRRMAPILARSALANGVAEIFAEVASRSRSCSLRWPEYAVYSRFKGYCAIMDGH